MASANAPALLATILEALESIVSLESKPGSRFLIDAFSMRTGLRFAR